MKKTLFIIAGLAAITLVSCSKEEEINTPNDTPAVEKGLSFNAYVDDDDITKTSYASETTFSWTGAECVSMQLIKKTDGTTRDRWLFYNETEAGGSSARFLSSGSLNSETWGLGEYAFYPFPGNSNCPDRLKSWNVGSWQAVNSGTAEQRQKNVIVSKLYKSSVSNPLQFVPMIGYKSGEDFAFHTATGILKITISNLDSRLAKVQLYSDGQKLNGTYTMTGEGTSAYIAMTTSTTASEYVVESQYTDWSSESELPFYFPVPVGTLNSAFEVRLLDGDDNVLRTVRAPSAVTIERNKISEITSKIALPAEDFSATITPGGTSTAIEATVDIAKDATSVKVVLAASESAGLTLIDSDDASVVTFADGETKALPMSNISTSGTAYVVAKTYKDATEKLSSATAVYVITAADAASICSQYVRDARTGSASLADLDLHGDNTITLEVSDDPTKGNIMITEFTGFTNVVANHTFTTWDREWASFTDGDPVYGLYGDSIVYGGNTGAEFYNVQDQIFYTDSSSSKHIISTGQSTLTTLKFAFNSDGYSSGTVHDLVVWNPYIGNSYNATLGSLDYYFNQYVAYKTKGKIALTESMVSVSSNCTDNSYGDAGGVAALIDKSASTYWHSDYFAVPTLDADYGIYMQIDLGASKTVSDFTIIFKTRSDSTHGIPTKYKVGVSNDGTNFTDLTGEVSISATAGAWFNTQKIAAGADYRYIRLGILEMNCYNGGSEAVDLTDIANASTNHYTHLAEIQLWEN